MAGQEKHIAEHRDYGLLLYKPWMLGLLGSNPDPAFMHGTLAKPLPLSGPQFPLLRGLC